MNDLSVAVAQNIPITQTNAEPGWIEEFIKNAAAKRADFLVLPELASVGYHLEKLKKL